MPTLRRPPHHVPRLSQSARSAICAAATVVAMQPGASFADPYADRVNAVRNTYYNGGWYFNYPADASGDSGAKQEWKKGIFYSAMAAFAANDITTGVTRTNQGLALRNQGDMFYLASLIHLYARFPQHFSTIASTTKVDMAEVRKALYKECWETIKPGLPNITPNQLLMYNTARLLAADDPYMAQVPPDAPQTTCQVPGLHIDLGVKWLREFMDSAVRGGFLEGDSTTYAPYYISLLRLIADKHHSNEPTRSDLAMKAGMTHDWIVANLAGEWLDGEYAGTSSRQYYAWDGTSYQPVEMGAYLWALFGGKPMATNKFYATITGLLPPAYPSFRKPTGAIVAPLAADIEASRPAPWLVAMGTERSGPYGQRESQREGLKVSYATRHVEPGVMQLATQSQPWPAAGQPASLQGWGVGQSQDFTFHWYGTTSANRSLTLASPLASSYDLVKPVGAQAQLQWVQQGRAAVGALFNGPQALIRGLVPTAAISSNNDWAATRETAGSDEGWHTFAIDNAFVGVRTATPLKAGSNGVNSEREFTSAGARNVVIVDSAPMAEYGNSRAAFLQALKARPITCIGVSAPTCTSPTSAPAVGYTSLTGDQLSITWPADGSRPTRMINGVVQDLNQWPVIENPWAYQAQGEPWLRMSGAGTTRIYHFGTPWMAGTAPTPWKVFTASAAPNGGFEAGTATSATQWVQGTWSGSPSYVRVSSPVHAGTAAASVTLANAGNGGFSLNATARPAAVSGQHVTVTAWLRTANVSNGGSPDGGAYVYAQYVDDAGNLLCSAATSTPITGTNTMWQSRSATLPSACPGATRVAVSVRLKGTGTLWMDDVDITVHD